MRSEKGPARPCSERYHFHLLVALSRCPFGVPLQRTVYLPCVCRCRVTTHMYRPSFCSLTRTHTHTTHTLACTFSFLVCVFARLRFGAWPCQLFSQSVRSDRRLVHAHTQLELLLLAQSCANCAGTSKFAFSAVVASFSLLVSFISSCFFFDSK